MAYMKNKLKLLILYLIPFFASADWFLVSDHDGSKVEFHSIDDDSYVKKVANSCSISVKMKSASIKSKTAKPGDRRWWSALGLTTKDLSTSINEEVDLNEGISAILRKSINVVKQKFKVIVATAKKLVKRNFRAFLHYLGFDADIDFHYFNPLSRNNNFNLFSIISPVSRRLEIPPEIQQHKGSG